MSWPTMERAKGRDWIAREEWAAGEHIWTRRVGGTSNTLADTGNRIRIDTLVTKTRARAKFKPEGTRNPANKARTCRQRLGEE